MQGAPAFRPLLSWYMSANSGRHSRHSAKACHQDSVAKSGSRQTRRGLWAATALPSGLLAASGFLGPGAARPERALAPVIAGWGRRGRSGRASPQPASCAWYVCDHFVDVTKMVVFGCLVGCSRWLLVPHGERMRKHPFEGERSEPERLTGTFRRGYKTIIDALFCVVPRLHGTMSHEYAL